MPLTRRVPKEAKRVISHIRDLVQKPTDQPTYVREDGERLSWKSYCPLGLLPGTRLGRPATMTSLGIVSSHLTNKEIMSFYVWWDDQTDPQAAVRAVWGRS